MKLRNLCSLALLAAAAAPATLCSAQAKVAATSGPPLSRFELYGGYSYFHPVNHSNINGHLYEDVTAGGLFAATFYFSPHLGVQIEGNYSPAASNDTHCVIAAQGGLVYRMQRGRFAPFVHALGGGVQIGGPALQPCDFYGYGVTGGGGLDYILPLFHNRLSLRPVQADFTYSHQDNGPLFVPPGTVGGVAEIYALRLSAGVSFRFGDIKAKEGGDATMTCSADPVNPFPGQPVTLSASVLNMKSYQSVAYIWTTTGGVVKGTEATETVDTTGLAPGNYDVTGRLVRTDKQRDVATCTTSFQVHAPLPPTVSCVADKAAINSGAPVIITTTASSPSNRPLIYSYSSTNGQVVGNGATATLSTAGSTPGDITVTCKVTDDAGASAQVTASVVVATPAPPPPPPQAVSSEQAQLCSISFERDRRRPDRVDNEAKACLDSLALLLNRDTTSHLALVGTHAARETNRNAAERVLNAADYLMKEKGIDPTRLELRTSDAPGRQVTSTVLPAGVTYSDAQAATIDATKVKRRGQPYGIPGHHPKPRRKPRARRKAVAPSAPVQ